MASASGHLPRYTGGDEREQGKEKREGFAICQLIPESVTEAEDAAERKWAGKGPQCAFI